MEQSFHLNDMTAIDELKVIFIRVGTGSKDQEKSMKIH